MKKKIFFVLGSIGAFLGVALGAHALKSSLSPEMLAVFETGVRYQMYHSFALLLAGWALEKDQSTQFLRAGWLFVVGILLFSCSLYLLALSGISAFGILTPFGGLAFLAGWFFLAAGFWKR